MFNENLRIFRKNLNVSQEKLASILNVNQRTISSWENNTSEPDIATIIKLSKIFNVSLDDLLL